MRSGAAAALILWIAALSSDVAFAEDAPRCRIDVHVRLESGEPAPAGLEMVLSNRTARETEFRKTDPSGGPIRFESVACGEAYVTHPSGTTPLLKRRRTVQLVPGEPGTLEFPIESLTPMDVTVVDLEGRPVSGVGLMPRRLHEPGESQWWGYTVRDAPGKSRYFMRPGRYRIRPPYDERVREVTVGDELARFPLMLEIGDRNMPAPPVVLRVAPRAVIAGRVVLEDGSGIQLVDVHGVRGGLDEGENAEYQAFTDEDGRFRMKVDSFPVELVPFLDNLRFEPPSVVVEAPGPALEFVGRPDLRVSRLSGRVIDAADGSGVCCTTVNVRSLCDASELPPDRTIAPVRASVVSGPEGDFTAPCNPDCPFAVWAHAEDYLSGELYSNAARSCTTPLIVKLQPAAELTIEVADTEGRAVPDFQLKLPSSNPTTDAHGVVHRRGMTPGTVQVDIEKLRRHPEHRWLALAARSDDGEDGHPVIDLAPGEEHFLSLTAVEGGEVCARAVDARGRPAAISEVRLHDADGTLLRRHLTTGLRRDTGVTCTTPVIPGRYRVRVAGPRLATSWSGSETANGDPTVEVFPGRQSHVEVRMPPGGGITIAADTWPVDSPFPGFELASDPDGGWQPVRDEDMRCLRLPPQSPAPGGLRCHLRGIPVGSWRVRLVSEDSPQGGFRSKGAVSVTAGGFPEIAIDSPGPRHDRSRPPTR